MACCTGVVDVRSSLNNTSYLNITSRVLKYLFPVLAYNVISRVRFCIGARN